MSNRSLAELTPAHTKSGLQRKPNEDAPRRTNHGSHAWTLPSQSETHYQPQDGALGGSDQVRDFRGSALLREMDARTVAASLRESEDAHLSGAMRSLARRVLGLNVTASYKSAPKPVQSQAYFAEPHLVKFERKDTRKPLGETRAAELLLSKRPQVA